jgi:macrolide-specific efflux system membrane fusion protein
LELSVLGTGTVRAAELVNVGAQVGGQIKTLAVQLGQHVSKGQLIAEIDSVSQVNALRMAKASLRQAEAQLRSSQASLTQTRLAWERQRALFDHDANAQQELEAAQYAYESAQANVKMQSAAIDTNKLAVSTARTNVTYTRITAPIAGEVVAVLATHGQTVNANQSTPNLVMLANVDTVRVRVRISEADVTRVKQGQKAHFTLLGDSEKRYETTLKAVEPAPDSIVNEGTTPTTGGNSSGIPIYYNGLMEVANPDGRLRISMTARVSIVLAEASQALAVPSSALLPGNTGGEGAVLVLDSNGKPARRRVRVGVDDKAFIEILEGLQAGEKVITGEIAENTASLPSPQSIGAFR